MSGSRSLRSELDSCNRARTVERVKTLQDEIVGEA